MSVIKYSDPIRHLTRTALYKRIKELEAALKEAQS
jgi:hypothetical protein